MNIKYLRAIVASLAFVSLASNKASELVVPLQQATATHSQEIGGFLIGNAIDGVADSSGWALYPNIQTQTAVFETVSDAGFEGGTRFTVKLASLHVSTAGGSHTLGRFRLAVTTDSREIFADGLHTGGDVTANWTILVPISATSQQGATLSILDDGSILASGEAPVTDTYTVTAETSLIGITGFRLEVLEDPSLPQNGPGRAENGNLVLSEMTVNMAPTEASGDLIILVPLQDQVSEYGASASFEVVVEGAEPITYEWKKDGVTIAGASGSSLVITDLEPGDAGEYVVTATNEESSVSSAATLALMAPTFPIALQNASATFSQEIGGLYASTAIDGNLADGKGWAIYPEMEAQTAVFETVETLSGTGDSLLIFTISSLHISPAGGSHALGRFRISATTDPREEFADGLQFDGDVSANWVVLQPVTAISQNGGILTVLEDGSILASGPAPETDVYTVAMVAPLAGVTGFRLEAMEDPSLPHNGPGRQISNGNYVVSEIELSISPGSIPPVILQQPVSTSVRVGEELLLEVIAASGGNVTFQWFKDDVAISGATNSTLLISDVQVANAGVYHVAVGNSIGDTVSEEAIVTVIPQDTEPPIVTIISPTTGTNETQTVALTGTAIDNERVVSLQLEGFGELVFSSEGEFSVQNVPLEPGENVLTVSATDAAGNIGSASVTVFYRPARSLRLAAVDPVREGGTLEIPLEFSSIGGVAGMTFQVMFRPDLLANPEFEWELAAPGMLTETHALGSNRLRVTFALPGQALPAGDLRIATLKFRVATVPMITSANIGLQVIGAYSETGEPLGETEAWPGTVQILPRLFVGDNNANGRLDVGDASVIMRYVALLEQPRSWDVHGNDLNSNLQVDTGDAIKVLRVAAELDPQPEGAIISEMSALSISGATGNAKAILTVDEMGIKAGEQVRVRVQLQGWDKPVSGASFKLIYPEELLRLNSNDAHRLGELVPASAVVLWNISPDQSSYLSQDGEVAVAISSAANWEQSAGDLAEFVFTAQSSLAPGQECEIRLTNVEIASDGGYGMSSLRDQVLVLSAPTPAGLVAGNLEGDGFSITAEGEIGKTYLIEVSEDLVNWRELTQQVNESGTIQVVDPTAGGASHRFYRATKVD